MIVTRQLSLVVLYRVLIYIFRKTLKAKKFVSKIIVIAAMNLLSVYFMLFWKSSPNDWRM